VATSKPALTRARLLELSEEVHQTLATELAPEAEGVPRLRQMKTSALRKLSLTRLESLQRLDELACWLYLYGRDEEALAVGRSLLVYPFDGDFTRYGPVEATLSRTAWLARERGDAALAEACGAHVLAVYGPRAEWSDAMQAATERRLGGWQVKWQEGNVEAAIAEGWSAGEIAYRAGQLGELAFLALWGGSEAWPMQRIRQRFEEQTDRLRRLRKITI
jgi:hypothetical protein